MHRPAGRTPALTVLCVLALLGGCQAAPPQRLARIDAALAGAGEFLLGRQDGDGAWRSQTYGCFKDGPSLTPNVLSSLFFLPQAGEAGRQAYRRGVDYLVAFVGDDGRLKVAPRELMFPVLTAASASRVVVLLDRSPRNLQAQQAWLAYLRRWQLTEPLGWSAADPSYGGWGFSLTEPRKPAPGMPLERFFESNMVATIHGLAALRSAKLPAEDPAFAGLLTFVQRCQNWPERPEEADERFDDGGFFFIPGDVLQNKAGPAGTDRLGRPRFRSYGSMTADGLRALLRSGLKADHPRVLAARRWLERNFSAAHNPGQFAADREVVRDGVYYYWAWAVSHAFLALGVQEIQTDGGTVRWAEALADELLRRQRPDGSWVNRFSDAKEDDPLVATSFAAAALAICRVTITSPSSHSPAGGCPTLAAPTWQPAVHRARQAP